MTTALCSRRCVLCAKYHLPSPHNPKHTRASATSGCQRVGWVGRHGPCKYFAGRTRLGPPRGPRAHCLRRADKDFSDEEIKDLQPFEKRAKKREPCAGLLLHLSLYFCGLHGAAAWSQVQLCGTLLTVCRARSLAALLLRSCQSCLLKDSTPRRALCSLWRPVQSQLSRDSDWLEQPASA